MIEKIVQDWILKTPPTMQKILGFGMLEYWWVSFLCAFAAGVLLWGIYWIIKGVRAVRLKTLDSKDYEEFSENKTRWLYIIVGRFWKVPVIAVFFTVAMEIPIIKSIIYFLVLGFLTDNELIRILAITFWLGLFPSLTENFFKERYRIKLQKKVWAAQEAGLVTRKQAKAIDETTRE